MKSDTCEIRIVPGLTAREREEAFRHLSKLTGEDTDPRVANDNRLVVLIPPHLIGLIQQARTSGDETGAEALLRTVVPSALEFENRTPSGWRVDGMGTVHHRQKFNLPSMAQPRCIRRLYPDRLVLTVCWQCPALCRYCFRKFEAGSDRKIDWQSGLNYIRAWNESGRPPIRDVIISGGDPLSLPDSDLDEIISQLRATPGVEVVRIDTKYLTTKPNRITRELADVLDNRVNIVTLHAAHPLEICGEMIEACRVLRRRGIILRSYTPILKGINDDRETLKRLFWNLLAKCGVTSYYAVQFVETPGARHFRTRLKTTLDLMRDLHTELSGPAIPNLIVYLPDGGGKYMVGPHERILDPCESGTGIRKINRGYQIPSPLNPGKFSFYPEW